MLKIRAKNWIKKLLKNCLGANHPKHILKMFVNDEVRDQLSQEISEGMLQKNTEKTRMIYLLNGKQLRAILS